MFLSKSKIQTQKLATEFSKVVLKETICSQKTIVIALSGELGSGKTAFVQGFIKALGVKSHIPSPTFVIYRKYKIKDKDYFVYHFDLYRIQKSKEIVDLGFKKIINPLAGKSRNIVLIEWPEKIKKILPKNTVWIDFKHGENEKERIINIL
ncbi:tRNA (adenosine(37)-N6)-threonylcarbamoyltransferase complex ATPase subunit type 1 TsaE [Patescibacteria group bacterium]|nr:tRNA (adenosine(37)-N6)-threonylcarbamoyltransferase complex ATPase subunit type 1 TsaE [Patescibacteria group bacterium]